MLASWKKHNPDWNVVFLCDRNLNQYIDVELDSSNLARLDKVQKSDLVRLQILHKHGGIWVDSTCFCLKPLNEWIYSYLDSGFFAFRNPGRDRLLSNWFLAASKNNTLIEQLYESLFYYLTTNEYRNVNKTRLMKVLKKFLSRSTKTTKYWFNPLFTKVLRLYPYYCFHYLFTELVNNERECGKIWDNTPELAADPCHTILKEMYTPLTSSLRESIDRPVVPVYKLSYKKYEKQFASEKSTIHYLLQTV